MDTPKKLPPMQYDIEYFALWNKLTGNYPGIESLGRFKLYCESEFCIKAFNPPQVTNNTK